MRQSIYFLIPFLQIFVLLAALAANNISSWKMPMTGGTAFLGVNGGHAESVVVCKTISDFRKRQDSISGHPSGCRRFHSGTSVVIQGLQYDPGSVFSGGYSMPVAKIFIPPEKFIGFVALDKGLIPDIPPETVLTVTSGGTTTFRLAASQGDISGSGPKFSKAIVKVIRQDAKIGDNGRDLYISVVSGKYEGKEGWIFGNLVNDLDGNPIDQFTYAILSPHQNIPKIYLLKKSATTISAALDSQRSVPPFDVRRGRPDFLRFVDYYAPGNYAAGEAVHCGLKDKAWGRHVLLESLRLLSARSVYDYPLETPGKADALKPAIYQVNAAIKAGLHAPLSACANLRSSPGYSLANSLAMLSPRKGD
jgi:hypothetical protein